MEGAISFLTKKEIIGTIVTIAVTYFLYLIFKFLIERLLLRKTKSEFDKKRKRTVVELLKKLLKVAFITIALIIILDLFGVNVTSLVASLGIASAVGALALQDTLKDVINGALIITDNYYVVGDVVKYDGFTGTVIEFGLKSTKIMNFDGEVMIISNRNIDKVINLSQKTAGATIIAPTAYEEKIEKVEKVLNQVIEEIRTWEKVDVEKTNYIGIVELNDSCINYGIRIACSPGKIWEYKRAALRLIKVYYDKNNIKIPYNQIEVHNEK